MSLVILKGSPQTQWNIENRFLNGNTPVEMTEEEITKYKDVILEIVGEKKAEPLIVEQPKEESKKKGRPKKVA